MREFTPKEIECLMATWMGARGMDEEQLRAHNRACARYIIHDIPGLAKGLLSDGESVPDLERHCTGLKELISDLAVCEGKGLLQGRHSKALLKEYFAFPHVDIAYLLRKTGVLDSEGAESIERACAEALAAHPKAVEEYLAGKQKALGALVGAVKKQVKADPKDIQDCLARLAGQQKQG